MPASPAADDPALPRERFELGAHPALDALRALAILAVVGRHLNEHDVVRGGGALGVGMFFALSGFLTTASLRRAHDRTGRTDVVAALRSRVLRIVPLLAACTAALALYDLRVDDFLEQREAVAALTFTANHAMIAGPTIGPVTHTWFLAALVQMIVGWLAIFPLVGARRDARGVVAVLVLAAMAWAWRAWLLAGDAAFERLRSAPDVRADAFLLGAAAALLVAHRRPRVPPWLLVAAAAALLWQLRVPPADEMTILIGWTLVPLATVVLAVGVVTTPGRWTDLLAWRPLRWIGVISYSLYLWHFPLYRVLDVELEPTGWSRTAILVGASLAVAAASHRLIEQPVGRWLSPDRRPR